MDFSFAFVPLTENKVVMVVVHLNTDFAFEIIFRTEYHLRDFRITAPRPAAALVFPP